MGPAWTEAFVIAYGDSPETLGTSPIGDSGRARIGPRYGAQTPDGTWWVLDSSNKRIAHFSPAGEYIDAVDLGPELLSGGRFFQYESPYGMADGAFVATDIDVGTSVLRIVNGEPDLAMASPSMSGSFSDGTRIYGFGFSGSPLALDPDIPEISRTDWFLTQTGSRFFLSVDASGLRIQLPDASPPVDRVVPIVTASDIDQAAFAGIEVTSTANGDIHVLLYGLALNDEDVQLGGFTTIRPDGSLTPVESVRNPFSDVDPSGPSHLGARFGAQSPWMMFIDNDGLRIYSRS
jgi:hypothetical protein